MCAPTLSPLPFLPRTKIFSPPPFTDTLPVPVRPTPPPPSKLPRPSISIQKAPPPLFASDFSSPSLPPKPVHKKSIQNKKVIWTSFLNNFHWVLDSCHRVEGKSSRELFEKVRANAVQFWGRSLRKIGENEPSVLAKNLARNEPQRVFEGSYEEGPFSSPRFGQQQDGKRHTSQKTLHYLCHFNWLFSLRSCRISGMEIWRESWWEFCGIFSDPQNKGLKARGKTSEHSSWEISCLKNNLSCQLRSADVPP